VEDNQYARKKFGVLPLKKMGTEERASSLLKKHGGGKEREIRGGDGENFPKFHSAHPIGGKNQDLSTGPTQAESEQ